MSFPDTRTSLTAPFPTRRSALLFATLLTGACATSQPRPDAEQTIAASLALPQAVVFHTEAGPLDVARAPIDELGLTSAIQLAIEASPELQASLARVRAAEAEADLAALLPNPILSLVVRIPEGGGQADIEAGLAADLLAILQRPRRSSAAAHRLEVEAASALSTALDVVAEVQELYAEAQVLDELVPLLEARVGVLDRLLEVARARLELGDATRHEATTLEAQRLELAIEVSQRRQERVVARMALARRIGEPSAPATWRLEAWERPAAVPIEESAWIATALRLRPEVLAIEWELRARGDERALAGSAALDGADFGVEAEREENWSIGPAASAPLPVFDTGSAHERRASALEAEARHRLLEARRAVITEVRTALATLGGSHENLDRVVLELVPLQERRRSEVEDAYRLGHVDVTALLLAEQALQEAQSLRLGLELQVSAARLRLERSVGGRTAVDTAISTTSDGSSDAAEREQ